MLVLVVGRCFSLTHPGPKVVSIGKSAVTWEQRGGDVIRPEFPPGMLSVTGQATRTSSRRTAPRMVSLPGLSLLPLVATPIGSCRPRMNSINCVNTHAISQRPLTINPKFAKTPVRCVTGLLATTGVRVRSTRPTRGTRISSMAFRAADHGSTRSASVRSELSSPSSLHLFAYSIYRWVQDFVKRCSCSQCRSYCEGTVHKVVHPRGWWQHKHRGEDKHSW